MTKKKSRPHVPEVRPVDWDSLTPDYTQCLKWFTSQSLIYGMPPCVSSTDLEELFSKSESLFSGDYLSFLGVPEQSKIDKLEDMCKPKKRAKLDISFWKGDSSLACLFVFIQHSVEKKELSRVFGPFGSIEEILIVGTHFAVIKFEFVVNAVYARKWICNSAYRGTYFCLNLPSKSIWVGNLHPDVSELQLISEFKHCGKIKTARLFKWKNYAFVNFFSLESSIYALECMQGHILSELPLKINFATEH